MMFFYHILYYDVFWTKYYLVLYYSMSIFLLFISFLLSLVLAQ